MSHEITLNDYVFSSKDKIGRGSSGIVYRGYHNKTRDKVAIKRVDISNLNEKMNKMWNEIQIMKSLSHPNIIKLYDVHLDIKNEYLYLIMEYCDGSDLSELIEDYVLDHKKIQNYMKQIRDGLSYLHSKGIVHRDLKPHNMLLSGDQIKIADFGLSVMNDHGHLMKTMCGSPLYMSPEIIEHQKYTAKSDLWSIGMILYQMIYRKHPFQDCRNFAELASRIKNDPIIYPDKPSIDSLTEDLIRGLLEKNCHQRMNWDEFFNHTWFEHQPIPQNDSLELSYHDMFETEISDSEDDESEEDPIIEVEPGLKTELTQSSYLFLSQSQHIKRSEAVPISNSNEKKYSNPEQNLSYQKRSYGYLSEEVVKDRGDFNLKSHLMKNYQKPPSRIPETMSRINPVRHNRPVNGTSAPNTVITNVSFSPSKLDFNSMGSGFMKVAGKSFNVIKNSIDT